MSPNKPAFATTRFTEGYDMSEVDVAVDRILAALADPTSRMTRSEVEALRFTSTRLRDGYVMSDVDTWLEQAVLELESRGTDGSPAPSSPAAPAPAAQTPATPADAAPTPAPESATPASPTSANAVPYVPPAGAQAITEVPSGGTPWLLILVALLVLGALALLLAA